MGWSTWVQLGEGCCVGYRDDETDSDEIKLLFSHNQFPCLFWFTPISPNYCSYDNKQLEAETALNGNHTYAMIPENFTLAAFSGEHSPNTLQTTPTTLQTKQVPVTVDGADYEIIDLDPVPAAGEGSRTTRKHQYEAVVNDEDDENYNRLQRSDSKSRKTSCSTTGTSVSPVVPSRGESTTPLSPVLKDSILFDNPKYSQLGKLGGQHPSIYKTASTDSNPGVANQSDVLIPAREPVTKAKAAKTLSSQKDDEYFHDSSMFIVNGLAQDETKRCTAQNSDVPSEHYSSLLSSTMNEESSYALAIVSSQEKYVSEKGHLYQVLEGGNPELKAAGKPDGEKSYRRNFASLSIESKESDDELGFTVTNSDACSSDGDADDAAACSPAATGSRTGAVYHTLLHSTPSSEDSRESSPGQTRPYDVIDRNLKSSAASSRSSGDGESPYNVIDRRVSEGNFSIQPPSQYDMIEPQSRRPKSDGNFTGQRVSQYSVIEPYGQTRRVSNANFTSQIPSQYDVIEPVTSPPRIGSTDSGYSKIARSRNPSVISFTQNVVSPRRPAESRLSPSPPPLYSSLDKQKQTEGVCNGGSPFGQAGEKEACQGRGPLYHALESEREDSDVTYHTIT